MIKQSWNINENEKLRILNLHETATKNQYLILEQKEVITKTIETGKPITFNLPNTFASGQYRITDTTSIDDAINKMNNYVKQYPIDSKFEVVIESSESQVPNKGVGLNPGDLSRLRAEEIEKYIKDKIPKNITPKIDNRGAQGPEWDSKLKSNNSAYTQYQYVKLIFSVSGKKENIQTKVIPVNCNVSIKNSNGGVIPSSKDFTQTQEWDLGEGEGQIYLYYETYYMPDIIYFIYDGKIVNQPIFAGDQSNQYRIYIGTALMVKYKGGQLPKQYGETQYRKLENSDKIIIESLPKMKEWVLTKCFNNLYGKGQEFDNPNYMNSFMKYDNSKGTERDGRILIKELGDDFPWGYLSSNMLPTVVKNIGPLSKKMGVNKITIVNVSPNGATGWSIGGTCKPF